MKAYFKLIMSVPAKDRAKGSGLAVAFQRRSRSVSSDFPNHTAIRLLLSLLALVPSALWVPAVARAQQIPWIGLAANGAQLHGEIGSGHDGPSAEDHFGFEVVAGDFDDDGFDDLASGIPGNDCDIVVSDCGAVQLRFGRALEPLVPWGVLDPAENPNERAEAFDEYGYALAAGDFNNDGHADLAVGAPSPYDPSVGNLDGGEVFVHYGLDVSLGRIQWIAEHAMSEEAGTLPDPPVGFGEIDLGAALASGDFNGDGHDDLAMGDPNYWDSDMGPFGRVFVAHGHVGGLVPYEGFQLEQGLDGLPDAREQWDRFGEALAAGDFNHDGYDDLAIAVPGEDGVGAVLVVYGSPFSLIFANHWYVGSFDLGGPVQDGMRFGEALAAGDFDGDGYDDLAIGSPRHDGGIPPTLIDSGLLTVAYGSESGLTAARLSWFWEEMLYGANSTEPFDNFGAALAAGDFDGDGADDLAVGTHGEDGGLQNSGAVTVLKGRLLEDLGGPARRLRPGPAPNPVDLIPDVENGTPLYGSALASGDFDGNGFDDLAIGATGRNNDSTLLNVGAVAVVYGRLFTDGFESGRSDAWSGVSP